MIRFPSPPPLPKFDCPGWLLRCPGLTRLAGLAGWPLGPQELREYAQRRVEKLIAGALEGLLNPTG